MASLIVRLGIPAIALALAATFVVAVNAAGRGAGLERRARLRHVTIALLGVSAYLGLIAALALTGLLARFDVRPPPLMLVMVATCVGAVGLGVSPLGARLATALPYAALVGFQAFRLPLELVMHRAATEKVMPSVMSFSGYNFDIVSGATALVLGLALAAARVPKGVILAWNLLGSVLLGAIVVIAVLATPLFHAFGPSQVNLWVTEFPYAWIAMMVGSALLGHVLVARKLLLERRALSRAPGSARYSAGVAS